MRNLRFKAQFITALASLTTMFIAELLPLPKWVRRLAVHGFIVFGLGALVGFEGSEDLLAGGAGHVIVVLASGGCAVHVGC